MRMVVVDASVATKWYVREAGSERALTLLDSEKLRLVAPDLLAIEVASGLLRQAREGQIGFTAVQRALADLRASGPDLMASGELIGSAASIAHRARHPIYDCIYLALADRLDTVLVTADLEFVDRCRTRLPDDPLTARLRRMEDLT